MPELMPPSNSMVITTSWDDGHPLDFRIADLLAKYGIPGTFYVPLKNVRPALSPAQIRELSLSFEIGAHTVNHVRLTGIDDWQARQEITDSKQQLEGIVGEPCRSFCFPGGKYSSAHLDMLRETGFEAVRTVELLCLRPPNTKRGIKLVPTTIQAYPHRSVAYLRNAALRGNTAAIRNLLIYGRGKGWLLFGERLLECAALQGGVFHLWGHSWEIEETGQWAELEQMLSAMAAYKERALFATNFELCGDVQALGTSNRPAFVP